jgi:hypothetical protein
MSESLFLSAVVVVVVVVVLVLPRSEYEMERINDAAGLALHNGGL